MKVLTMLAFMVIAAFLGMTLASSQKQLQPVNAMIGDESFVETFGRRPDNQTSEALRIETHLAYVEKKLRSRNVTHLPEHLQKKRQQLLELLEEYRDAGRFPKNYDYPSERRPCFIDRDGAICAVGYLIEQTAGRAVAERINTRHQYDYIQDMEMPEVKEWIQQSGLTEEECAMIQPSYFSYGPSEYVSRNRISTAYGISSGIAGGLGLGISALNIHQLQTGSNDQWIPAIGMLSGAGEIVLGLVNRPEPLGTAYKIDGKYVDMKNMICGGCYGTLTEVYYTNRHQEILSWANVSLGALTMALSSWNLFHRKEENQKHFQKSTRYGVTALPNSGIRITMLKSF